MGSRDSLVKSSEKRGKNWEACHGLRLNGQASPAINKFKVREVEVARHNPQMKKAPILRLGL